MNQPAITMYYRSIFDSIAQARDEWINQQSNCTIVVSWTVLPELVMNQPAITMYYRSILDSIARASDE